MAVSRVAIWLDRMLLRIHNSWYQFITAKPWSCHQNRRIRLVCQNIMYLLRHELLTSAFEIPCNVFVDQGFRNTFSILSCRLGIKQLNMIPEAASKAIILFFITISGRGLEPGKIFRMNLWESLEPSSTLDLHLSSISSISKHNATLRTDFIVLWMNTLLYRE